MEKEKEIVWVRLLRQGNNAGLRALFDKYYVVLCRYVSTIIGDHEAAEDVVQSIFIYLWEHHDSIDIHTDIKKYLFTAAKNKALNWLRDNSRFTSLSPEETDISIYEDLSVEMEELHNLIEKAIQNLPDKCKEIFQLSRDEELTYKEIASLKGISQKTVEAQIHIAIKKLRLYLSKYY
jgi:RNA polymerase sigma-70 factor (ECF subfamily)